MLRWVREYERHYFSGKRLVLGVCIKPKLPDYASFGLFNFVGISDEVIRSSKLTRILLLREMVHAQLFFQNEDGDIKHGPRFQAEIERLMAAGAYDRIL